MVRNRDIMIRITIMTIMMLLIQQDYDDDESSLMMVGICQDDFDDFDDP